MNQPSLNQLEGAPVYPVARLSTPAEGLHWADEGWSHNRQRLTNFHRRGSPHRPEVEACLAVSSWGLHVAFRVKGDRAVVCRHHQTNGPVCRDSCVEFFVEPPDLQPASSTGRGYINFEANCGGTMLASWVREPVLRDESGWCTPLKTEEIATISVHSSLMDRALDEEIPGPIDWSLAMHIPLALIRSYTSPRLQLEGKWRANLYKCADDSSLPHWASWSPIGERLDFHQPARFGTLVMPT